MSNPSGQGNHPQQSWNSEKPSPQHPQHPSWNAEDNNNRPSSTRPSSTYPPPLSFQSHPPAPYNQQPYPQSAYPPPPSAYPPAPPSGMAAVHSQVQGSQDPYHRLPPPPAPGPYQRPDMYAQPPPGPQVVYQAAAPRQRTAIACRYCRRRKIRCSGFESSPDGRCTNCVRFNQECMFTPVSSQAQAFVPAHAAYPHLRSQAQAGRGRGYPGDNVVLYGAHGQPLPPQQAMPESTLPPPQGAYYQPPYGRPHVDDRIPPPPMQHHLPHDQGGRRGSGAGFEYPEPINLAPVSTGPPAAGYPPAPYYHAAPPPPPLDRRASPQSYSYDRPGYPPMPAHGTPPPIATPGSSRGPLNVRDILNNPPGDSTGANGGRSSTDSDMLNQLNRKV
ncbi:C6 transcription factor, putative [Talaromyces stipitatus ATCC 10500]|uniref:C6 transcription factor, putative n=1 Tax=Talaromyces stipitatus (strain ATCC 10500 / CBS 375.48 / QM 6759 / NRRL 1006) TaxID=441959 RepID=B8M6H1_TALSN|nr:C6 transcription factor, putative [Talaromyces stipitatus ATCC 10500]EED19346.1 C6 transcription factor, putative [Talaromyces stipitatus ATCC 10500]